MHTAEIASLATAGGTLILAVATFSATRSANRSARISEKALRLNLRPVLVPTREHDDDELVIFGDQRRVRLDGSRAAVEVEADAIYLAFGLRNVGPGMAMLVAWKVSPATLGADDDHADLSEMTLQVRDLSVPGGDTGYWQAALRDPADDLFTSTRRAIEQREPITVELYYTDLVGSHPTISRFRLTSHDDDGKWFCAVSRHWTL
jgi:hypothetical protein